MAPELIITVPDRPARSIRLDQLSYRLGRSTSNELAFPDDAGLSRHHLLIEKEFGEWTVTDMGSKNGTLLNGVRLTQRQRLRPGDAITVSSVKIVYGEPALSESLSDARTVGFDAGPEPTNLSAGLRPLALTEPETPEDQALAPAAALLRVGRAMAALTTVRELYEETLRLALLAVGSQRGVLMTREEAQLIVQVARGEGFRIHRRVRDTVLLQGGSLLVAGDAATPSAIAVPLQTDQAVLGMLYLESAVSSFSADDLNLITAIANLAALRIEHVRNLVLEESRRGLAYELQQATLVLRSALPRKLPSVPGFDLAAVYQTCPTVGGDYHAFLTPQAGRVSVVVAGIAGRGMTAALTALAVKHRVETLIETVSEPAPFLNRINRMAEGICLPNRPVSMFYAVADTMSGVITYANAGHVPGILVRENGQVEQLRKGGPVIGLLSLMQFESATVLTHSGDLLAICSDGVLETTNADGVEFGEERLTKLLQERRELSAADIAESVMQSLQAWSGGPAKGDDQTIVVLKKVEC